MPNETDQKILELIQEVENRELNEEILTLKKKFTKKKRRSLKNDDREFGGDVD
jgi:hypothetical protein